MDAKITITMTPKEFDTVRHALETSRNWHTVEGKKAENSPSYRQDCKNKAGVCTLLLEKLK